MRKQKKIHLKKICVLSAVFVFSANIFCQNENKLAHVDLNAIYYLLPEIDSINNVLDDEKYELEIALENMQVEYDLLKDSFNSEYKDAPESVQTMKIKELNDMGKKIEQFTLDAKNTIKKRNQELAIPIYNKVNRAVEKVAQRENILYVFDISRDQIIYVSNKAIGIDTLVKLELGLSVFE